VGNDKLVENAPPIGTKGWAGPADNVGRRALIARRQARWRPAWGVLGALVIAGSCVPIAANASATSPQWAPGTVSAPGTMRSAGAGCASGTVCVTVDPDTAVGNADFVAQGFLKGIDSSTPPALVSALAPRSWVVGGTGDDFRTARSNGASVTELLSDLWYDSQPAASRQTPWANFTTYTAWVRRTATAQLANGTTPDYWEIQNEPDGLYGTFRPATVAQALEQYRIATTTIRSVDPTAKFVGPGTISPLPSKLSVLDMPTFLNYVAANNLPLDAVSWHEVSHLGPGVVLSNIARVRFMLAAHPRLAHLPIFINEYQTDLNHLIPGWSVEWISLLESAGIAQAGRACWHDIDVAGKSIAECSEGGLDGLVQPGSGKPEDLYWLYLAYAQMGGVRLATSSSSPTVSAFATIDRSTGTLRVLVGRHVSCTPAVRISCTQPTAPAPAPIPITLRVLQPSGYSTAVVSVTRIPNVAGPMLPPGPEAVPQLQTIANLTVPLHGGAGIQDGDAYSVTLSLH
jgi:hypothetical protein